MSLQDMIVLDGIRIERLSLSKVLRIALRIKRDAAARDIRLLRIPAQEASEAELCEMQSLVIGQNVLSRCTKALLKAAATRQSFKTLLRISASTMSGVDHTFELLKIGHEVMGIEPDDKDPFWDFINRMPLKKEKTKGTSHGKRRPNKGESSKCREELGSEDRIG